MEQQKSSTSIPEIVHIKSILKNRRSLQKPKKKKYNRMRRHTMPCTLLTSQCRIMDKECSNTYLQQLGKESIAKLSGGDISITVTEQYSSDSDDYSTQSSDSHTSELIKAEYYHLILCSFFVFLVVTFTTVMVIKRGGY